MDAGLIKMIKKGHMSNLIANHVPFSFSLQDPEIGNAYLSTFGVVQAVVEIVLMMYPTLFMINVWYLKLFACEFP